MNNSSFGMTGYHRLIGVRCAVTAVALVRLDCPGRRLVGQDRS